MKSPLLYLACSFALGIALAGPRGGLREASLLVFGGALGLLIGLVVLRAGWLRLAGLLALAGFALSGAAAARLFELRFPPHHVSHLEAVGIDLNDPVRMEGIVASTPRRSPYGLQFDLDSRQLESRAQARPVTGKIRLRIQASEEPEIANSNSLDLQYGDMIRALVQLRRPRVYRNPGSFNFRRWMESIEDLYWVGTIKSPLLVEKLSRAEGAAAVSGIFEKTRHRLLRGIDRLYPTWSAAGRNGSVLKAVLLGDRSSLDSETIENFRKAGLYHLLVIAGLHVGLLALLAGLALRFLHVRKSARAILIMLFLAGYALLVEQRAPTLRATLMIAAYLLARWHYRKPAALNAVGLAALILLLHRPAWLFDSGFQLSFAAALLIAGLVAPILERTTEPCLRAFLRWHDAAGDAELTPRLAQFRIDMRNTVEALTARFRFLHRHPRLAEGAVVIPINFGLWAANIFLFSAVLQLGLLLPMAENFHRISYAGIVLNALALPLMTVLLGLAVPTVIASAFIPSLAGWLSWPLGLILQILFFLADPPHLPAWLSYRVPEPPRWVAWGFAVSVILTACALGRWRRTFWASLGVLAIFAALISLHPFAPRIPSEELEVTALDCGGGESIFVVLPDRTTILVDAGGSRGRPLHEGGVARPRWDPGEDIVSPYLWSRGLSKIDLVVLTHAHEDHMGGLGAVVRNFGIGEFWLGTSPSTPAFQALLEEIRRRGIFVRKVFTGEVAERGTASVRILWPPASRSNERFLANDDSVVMRISDATASVLLTGDISGKVEQELMESGSPLASRVLKVAHHGSKSSSTPEFLARVSPQVALIAGEGGPLVNLPNPETLARLCATGAQTYWTVLDGAVTVEMKGKEFTVHNFTASTGEGRADADGAPSSRAVAFSSR